MAERMTPERRALIGRINAHRQHAMGRTNTGPARAAFMGRFERQVDPGGTLPPAERARRADHAKRAYFLDLAAKSAAARRKK